MASSHVDDFQARSSDELSLAKGDRVELIERDDEFGDGWFLGRHLVNSNTGLFPEGLSVPRWHHIPAETTNICQSTLGRPPRIFLPARLLQNPTVPSQHKSLE